MPTIFNNIDGYRIYFVSYDCIEPMHVHVSIQNSVCKFWIRENKPVLAWQKRFNTTELNEISNIIVANIKIIKDAWDETCKGTEPKKYKKKN